MTHAAVELPLFKDDYARLIPKDTASQLRELLRGIHAQIEGAEEETKRLYFPEQVKLLSMTNSPTFIVNLSIDTDEKYPAYRKALMQAIAPIKESLLEGLKALTTPEPVHISPTLTATKVIQTSKSVHTGELVIGGPQSGSEVKQYSVETLIEAESHPEVPRLRAVRHPSSIDLEVGSQFRPYLLASVRLDKVLERYDRLNLLAEVVPHSWTRLFNYPQHGKRSKLESEILDVHFVPIYPSGVVTARRMEKISGGKVVKEYNQD